MLSGSSRLDRWLGPLNGPQTLGRGAPFWLCFVAVVALLAVAPSFLSRYDVINFSNFLISGLLALSLALIWGYCGILSLGQAAFFGIGGYAYGIVAMNLLKAHGNTDVAFIAGIMVPAMFAALIGAILFYARLRGVYIAILMLVISLVIGTFLRQTADPSYTIGAAYLGGMNGLRPKSPDDPLLPSLIFGFGDAVAEFDGRSVAFYHLVLGIVVAVYLGLRCLVNSTYGFLLVGCREEIERTETFGYDVRLIQLSVFCIAAAVAGLSGVLYTAWGTYIHPDGFGVAQNILVVIWVAVGGRRDLLAALLGALVLNWISLRLASEGEFALLVMGALLVGVMLLAPEGIFVSLGDRLGRLFGRAARAGAAAPEQR
ncbi:MAG: branched-chain amino acid ABC transporter permease [Alphaproteobacteria bacterium]